jgi:signal transduction histidine kinase
MLSNNMSNPEKNQSLNFYNVKILRMYVAYLRQELDWSEAQVESLFDTVGADIGLLTYDDNYFDQRLADRFHEVLVELTGDPDIAYHVGVYATHQSAKGIAGRMISGFLSPSATYRNLGHFAADYSKGASITTEKVTHNSAIIKSVPVPSCEEKPYQCQNRIGMFESIPTLFNLPKAVITHPKCFHRGDEYCEYHVRWIEQTYRYAAHLSASLFVAVFIGLLLHDTSIAYAFLFSLGLTGGVYSILDRISNQRLTRALNEQIEALRISHDTIERRHLESSMVAKIHAIVNKMMPVKDLCQVVTQAIHQHMGYDRVTIFLYYPQQQKLRAVGYAGVSEADRKVLEHAEFNVAEDNTDGFLTSVLNTGNSIFVRDVDRELSKNSLRSQGVIKDLNVKSFTAVPIKFENKIFGVLAVDNVTPAKLLTENDRQLLADVSIPVGISFENAESFEKLQNSKMLLEELVEERTHELVTARDEAVQASKAKTLFLANMSHELRTPLNAILGFSELIQYEAAESHLKQIAIDNKKVIDSAKHLLTLISDLLDMSKIESGKMELHVETYSLIHLLETTQQIAEQLAKVNRNTVSFEVSDEISTLVGDEKKTKQILLNLISNACKFTEDGQISVRVKPLVDNPAVVCFEVNDTGIGIPKDKMNRLFQDFSQVDTSTSKKFGGTGLGLSLSKRFCEMMGGTIEVESTEGVGTTFRVLLPIDVNAGRVPVTPLSVRSTG